MALHAGHLGFLRRLAVVGVLFVTGLTADAGVAPGPHETNRPKFVVVLIHGIWNTGRMFDPMAAALREQGYTCFAPDLRPNDGRNGIRDLSDKLAGQINARFGPRRPLVLIGFSMGGIVARDYVENVVPDRRRVRGVFLLASAAKGTLWANLSPRAGQRQMAIGSPFLRELNARGASWRGITVHAYWTPLDLMVVPAANSRWPEGEATRIPCPVHPWMVRNRVLLADLTRRLRRI